MAYVLLTSSQMTYVWLTYSRMAYVWNLREFPTLILAVSENHP